MVAIVIDQFRYDYLTRFAGEYRGGIGRMLGGGADFSNAFYEQVPTVTAAGHSVFLSGAMPSVSGIVGNSWYDRQESQIVTSVCDWSEHVAGAADPPKQNKCTDADPASPRRLLVSTLGDELRGRDSTSKVIGISLKPRAAILPSGHRANGAYWFDGKSGNFISSTFYMRQLPDWALQWNARRRADEYVNRPWRQFTGFRGSAGEPYGNLAASPWGNEIVEQFVEAAVGGEKLGERGVTDLLTVSFSSNDYVGHRFGPDSPEVKDMALRVDESIGRLFDKLDQSIGMRNVLVVLSADHGVSESADTNRANRMPGGSVDPHAVEIAVESALETKFGEGPWIVAGGGEAQIYYTRPERAAEFSPIAEQALFANGALHVARVYTRAQLNNGVPRDFVSEAEANGFHARRSGDLFIVFEPGYLWGSATGTTHFSPWNYDRHVPVLFYGPGVKPGRYDNRIAPNDIAPTLATMLELETPNGSSGRVLTEMLAH